MEIVAKILKRKKQGIDCTEAESAEVKGYIKEMRLSEKPNPLEKDIIEHFPLEYGEAIGECEKLEDSLIDEVIGRIKEDIEAGDVSALFELLSFMPRKNLLAYLPEEKWELFPEVVRANKKHFS